MVDLKVGDVVQLKSGGPEMTVAKVGEDGLIGCQWFVVSGEVSRFSFAADTLAAVIAGGDGEGSCETSCETSCP